MCYIGRAEFRQASFPLFSTKKDLSAAPPPHTHTPLYSLGRNTLSFVGESGRTWKRTYKVTEPQPSLQQTQRCRVSNSSVEVAEAEARAPLNGRGRP